MTKEEFVKMFEEYDERFMYDFLDLNAEVRLKFRPGDWKLWIYVTGLYVFPGVGFIQEVCDNGEVGVLPDKVKEIMLDWLEKRFKEMVEEW